MEKPLKDCTFAKLAELLKDLIPTCVNMLNPDIIPQAILARLVEKLFKLTKLVISTKKNVDYDWLPNE